MLTTHKLPVCGYSNKTGYDTFLFFFLKHTRCQHYYLLVSKICPDLYKFVAIFEDHQEWKETKIGDGQKSASNVGYHHQSSSQCNVKL